MTRIRKLNQVPNLSLSSIQLADICAKQIWVGIDYSTGKTITGKKETYRTSEDGYKSASVRTVTLSDELFLETFATPFLSSVQDSKIKCDTFINDSDIENLIDVTQNLYSKIKKSNVDKQNGLTVLMADILHVYETWDKELSNTSSSKDATQITLSLAEAFFKSKNDEEGAQISLASRLLFFAIPDMPLYNYSSGIATGLNLKGSPKGFIGDYLDSLEDGYLRNWEMLSRFEMPLPLSLDKEIWSKARNSGWWQRRIYDLALKFYYESEEGLSIQLNETVKQQFLTRPFTRL